MKCSNGNALGLDGVPIESCRIMIDTDTNTETNIQDYLTLLVGSIMVKVYHKVGVVEYRTEIC